MNPTKIAGIVFDREQAKEVRLIRDIAAYSARIRALARAATAQAAHTALPAVEDAADDPTPRFDDAWTWPSRRIAS